jgi:soluble lytic murein transglycosylase-like protein
LIGEKSMTRAQSFTLPAAMIVCLFLAWIGMIAASTLPAEMVAAASNLSQPAQVIPANPAGEKNQSAPASGPGGSEACPLAASYPDAIRQWCNLILVYSGENGLAPDLVAAVILQESGGNPQAYSSDGAVGLMQVMPSDGLAAAFQCPSGPCFARRPTITQLLDPEFNISFGTAMLAGLIEKYNSIRDGLKYYGPAGIGYAYADKVLTIWENYQ